MIWSHKTTLVYIIRFNTKISEFFSMQSIYIFCIILTMGNQYFLSVQHSPIFFPMEANYLPSSVQNESLYKIEVISLFKWSGIRIKIKI
jgi:hypothetical protein